MCHLSIKGVFSVSTRSVTEEAHNVWQEVSSDSHRVRQDIVDSDLITRLRPLDLGLPTDVLATYFHQVAHFL